MVKEALNLLLDPPGGGGGDSNIDVCVKLWWTSVLCMVQRQRCNSRFRRFHWHLLCRRNRQAYCMTQSRRLETGQG